MSHNDDRFLVNADRNPSKSYGNWMTLVDSRFDGIGVHAILDTSVKQITYPKMQGVIDCPSGVVYITSLMPRLAIPHKLGPYPCLMDDYDQVVKQQSDVIAEECMRLGLSLLDQSVRLREHPYG